MTERRPAYDAHSGTTDPLSERRETLLACEGRSTSLPCKPDTLFLLPILESPYSDEENSVCLHLVHLPNGKLGLCNASTSQTCVCCGLAMCEQHQSSRSLTLPDRFGVWQKPHQAPLCETCAALSIEQIYALHDFCIAINDPVLSQNIEKDRYSD
jgi:hypothetical protein